MKQLNNKEIIKVPKDVTVEVKSRAVTVTGKFGTLNAAFRHISCDIVKLENGNISVEMWFGLSKQLASLRTIVAHINNMIKGVTKKYQYKMRLVYAHFLININITDGGKVIEIRNFLGEKRVRRIAMLGDTIITKSETTKDELVLEGTDVQLVSRSAALIRQSVLVKEKDIRKFLDGIYVSEKGHVIEE